MKSFKIELQKKIRESKKNNFGIENYDDHRFGPYLEKKITAYITNKPVFNFTYILKSQVKKIIGYKSRQFVNAKLKSINNYLDRLQFFWEQVNEEDKNLLVDIIAYRLLGYKKIKLPINNPSYWNAIEKAATLKDDKDTHDPHFLHFILKKYDLAEIGYNIEFYFTDLGIATDFIIEQYAYKSKNEYLVSAEKEDIVLDLGACWGDTALYFAAKAGVHGKVYSFEFIPENIHIFKKNIALNFSFINRIELVKHPVSDRTGQEIFFKDNGPASRIETRPFEGQTGSATTISIDDFVRSKNLAHVNFIKMDIEGAERKALEGAIETIKKFRPKLAIAIYHSMEDIVNIPMWIAGLNLGYKMYIGHYTIHTEETILFASN